MADRMDTCASCRFLKPLLVGGECRIDAPKPEDHTVMGAEHRAVWPMVAQSDWCGRYEPSGRG